MTRLCAKLAMAILVSAAGCESPGVQRPEPNPNSAVSPLQTPIVLANVSTRTSEELILASSDGTVQEEVVILDMDPLPDEGVLEVEVPAVIVAALADSPFIPFECDRDQARAHNLNPGGVVSNDDGSVQEEVVFVDSEEDQPCDKAPRQDGSTLAMAAPLPSE